MWNDQKLPVMLGCVPDLPPHFLQIATECSVPAVPRGGGSSGAVSLGVFTRLVPDLLQGILRVGLSIRAIADKKFKRD
jgi:hypothetical protein